MRILLLFFLMSIMSPFILSCRRSFSLIICLLLLWLILLLIWWLVFLIISIVVLVLLVISIVISSWVVVSIALSLVLFIVGLMMMRNGLVSTINSLILITFSWLGLGWRLLLKLLRSSLVLKILRLGVGCSRVLLIESIKLLNKKMLTHSWFYPDYTESLLIDRSGYCCKVNDTNNFQAWMEVLAHFWTTWLVDLHSWD